MLRVENEDRTKITYAEHFMVVVVEAGAFDGWYRGEVRAHVPGSLKLKEPGEVHRDLKVHAPFTIQGASFAPELVAQAADALSLRGSPHFRAAGFGPGEDATALAFAMHEALIRPDATEIERATRVAETLGALLSGQAPTIRRAPRAVIRARNYLQETLTERVTLDGLADYAGLDKFHLIRAFRDQLGLPPYEYLTYLRVSRARELLRRGSSVSEAAQAVGLYDQSQLHRHFRRIVGVTPGAYARSFQHRPSRAGAEQVWSRHAHQSTH